MKNIGGKIISSLDNIVTPSLFQLFYTVWVVFFIIQIFKAATSDITIVNLSSILDTLIVKKQFLYQEVKRSWHFN